MSQEVDRQKVLQTTRVRTSFKDDFSWIHKSKQAVDSTESAECALETKPSHRDISYVLFTAKKFESTESPQEEQPTATEGPQTPTDNGVESGNRIDVSSEPLPSVQSNDQPTAVTATEETNDIEAGKSNEHSESAAEVSTNVDVKDAAETSAEAGTEHHNDVAEVSEQKPVNGCSTDSEQMAEDPEKENCDECLASEDTKDVAADAVVETTIVANTASKEEAPPEESVVPDLLAESVYKTSSPPAPEAPVQENDEKQAQALDILATSLVEPLLPVINAESNGATVHSDPGSDSLVDQSTVEPAAEPVVKAETPDEDTIPPNNTEPAVGEAVEETVKEAAEVENPPPEISEVAPDVHQDNTEPDPESTPSTEQPSPKEDTAVTNGEDTHPQNSVEPNGGEIEEDTTKCSLSGTQSQVSSCEVCADQTTTDQELKSADTTEAEIPVVTKVAPEESVQPIPDPPESTEEVTGAETVVVSSEISAVSDVVSEDPKAAVVPAPESVVDSELNSENISSKMVEEEVNVEPSLEKLTVTDAAQAEECSCPETTDANTASESCTAESTEDSNEPEMQCTAETPAVTQEEKAAVESDYQTCAQAGVSEEETVEAEVVVGSSSEVPAIINAAETTVEENSPEAPIVNDAAPVEETPCEVTKNTETETGVEAVQVEAVAESPPEISAVSSVNQEALELHDALESISVPNGDTGQSKLDEGTVELTDALTETPTDKTVTESAKDPNHTDNLQDSKVELRPNDNNTHSSVEKEEVNSKSFIIRDGKEVCSHCDQFIGYIKITVSDPPMYLHPDCLKCGACTKTLGDLLTPMFEHNQLIYCDDCYGKVSEV